MKMTDTDGTCLATTLDVKVSSEPEESEEEKEEEEEESVTRNVELASDHIPASLLSYFESSKSRAAIYEKLILEDVEDLPASHLSEWALAVKLDPRKQIEQVFCDTGKQEDQSDTSPFLKPTDKQEAFSPRIVSLCSSIEGEGAFDENVEDEAKICDSEAERQKRQQEEMNDTEQRRQREQEFQEELRRIMETEKLHQVELEEKRKKAEEKLEQELHLQQELIGDLQKRVEHERRMIEEEQRRNREEQRKRKEREEEEKKKQKEERRKQKEEERKRVEMRLKEEEDRRKREEAQRKVEEEEKNRQMVIMRLKEEEENRKEEEEWRKVVAMKLKEEEDMIKEAKRREREEEKRRNIEKRLREEEDMRQKKEAERRWQEEEEKRRWSEMQLRKEEDRRKKEADEKRKWAEVEKKKEEAGKKEEERIKVTQVIEGKKWAEQKEENGMESHELNGETKEEANMMQVPESKVVEMKENRELELNEELRKLGKEEEGEEKEESEKKREIEGRVVVREDGREEDGVRSLNQLVMKTEQETNCQDEPRKTKEGERKTRADTEQEEKVKEKDEVKKEEEVMAASMENKEKEIQLVRIKEKRTKDEEKSQSIAKEEPPRREEEEEMKDKESVLIMKEKDEDNMCKQDSRVNHERKPEEEKQGEVGMLHEEQDIGGNSKVGNIEREERRMEESRGSSPPSSESCQPAPAAGDAAPCTPETPSEHLLLQRTEEKRLCWMKECVSWSTLAHHNRRKQRGSARGQRGVRRTPETTRLPPLCPHTLLPATGWTSLQEVTVLSMEELPACSLSTLVHCSQLQSLTLRRCGLRALEGISSLHKLCYIDLQENDISYVDCENMTKLRVLRLARNKLTSIHGLSGLHSLGVLDLSHNSITRIAGLESTRSLQKLLVAHNQLVSTKGLRDVCTLLHLDCSHNHLVRVEGLENNALLHTLDLSANSLAEPPGLSNHVLLQELHLDENSISSLRGLAACWLPLMWHLSVGHNSITELPPMSDFVSLEYLDLKCNCLSELQGMCESLEGCQSLREVHLGGNPLQQESGWRSTLQKAMSGLRCVDGQHTEPGLPPLSALPSASTLCSFRTFCQAQLEQTRGLRRRHSRELSSASGPLDAVETFCLHLTETLKLAEVHRFAHEYGDTTVSELQAGEQTTPKQVPNVDVAGKLPAQPKVENTKDVRPVIRSRDDSECGHLTSETVPVTGSRHGSSDTVVEGQKLSFSSKTCKASSDIEDSPADLENAAALVIQQRWKTYRRRCRNVTAPPVIQKGGEGEEAVGGRPESGSSGFMRGAFSKGNAAAVIQAFWRGYTLRKRLASALAAVTWPDAAEDDTFEEVDVDELAFDEASLDKQWTLTLSTDLPLRHHPLSEQPLFAKPPETCPGPSQSTFQIGNPKQAWVAQGEAHKTSPGTYQRSKSPALPSVLSGLSKRSEEILDEWGFTDSHTALLMLKRAQKMRATDRPQRKQRDPSARQAAFRNNHHQPGQVEALNRPAPRNRSFVKVGEATLGLQHPAMAQRGSRGRARQRQHAHTDRLLESEHFLPEINSSVLKGGRVQLVADPASADHLHHVTGLWANDGSSSSSSSSLAAWHCRVSSPPRRSSSGRARQDLPSQERGTSAPVKKERIPAKDSGRRQTWDTMNKWT